MGRCFVCRKSVLSNMPILHLICEVRTIWNCRSAPHECLHNFSSACSSWLHDATETDLMVFWPIRPCVRYTEESMANAKQEPTAQRTVYTRILYNTLFGQPISYLSGTRIHLNLFKRISLYRGNCAINDCCHRDANIDKSKCRKSSFVRATSSSDSRSAVH